MKSLETQLFKTGYWEVDNTIFTNKYLALLKASEKSRPVYFKYNNHVWENYSTKSLPGMSLNQLYKLRAEQIRDRYQYLILYYSGGADSHNILRTFVDNGIKLDEICVKWPKALRDGKFYSPNNIDKRPQNFWSEWNYSIHPVLKTLAKQNQIKINVIDPIAEFNKAEQNIILNQIDHDRNPGVILLNSAFSKSYQKHSVGHIYGIDKPLLCLDNDTISMFFTDFPFTTCSKMPEMADSVECFYWAPDLPALTTKMAHVMADFFVQHPQFSKYLSWQDQNACSQFQNDLAIKLCYDTWDYRFQTLKPLDSGRNDKYSWFNNQLELSDLNNVMRNSLKERKQLILSDYFNKGSIRTIYTKKFPLKPITCVPNIQLSK